MNENPLVLNHLLNELHRNWERGETEPGFNDRKSKWYMNEHDFKLILMLTWQYKRVYRNNRLFWKDIIIDNSQKDFPILK